MPGFEKLLAEGHARQLLTGDPVQSHLGRHQEEGRLVSLTALLEDCCLSAKSLCLLAADFAIPGPED